MKDNGQWTTDDGPRMMDNGQRTTDNGQRTTDNGRQTLDRSVLQEEQGSNQGQAVQGFESQVKKSTSTLLVLSLT
jgi:hypothetical protein